MAQKQQDKQKQETKPEVFNFGYIKTAATERARLQRYYYRNKYRLVTILIAILVIVAFGSSVYSYMLISQPKPMFYFTTNQVGSIQPLQPLRG